MPIETYGLVWKPDIEQIEIEMAMVRAGGYVAGHNGEKFGLGLFHHYRALITILWPESEHHRWSDLILKGYCEESITIAQGPKSCSKTYSWARIALADYWTFPNETLWLVSSTELRGLDLRVWGEIKDLFNQARDRFPWLSGHVLESKRGIFTDEVSEEGGRDIRRGLICIPCIGGQGEWIGMDKYVGIYQKRRRLLGDELQFMKAPYLSSLEHLQKGDFKMGGSGNPIGQDDPLDRLAEPEGGWGTEPQSEKTETWRNKWGGITINFDGRDSPNNDEPKNRYSFLISQIDVDRTKGRWGDDSSNYWNQVVGKRKVGLLAHRVLTVQDCKKHGAFEECVWSGEPTIKVYGLDAAFGGDRAVSGFIEFGREVGGRTVIKIHPPRTIPISISEDKPSPEDQLALAVKADCNSGGIPGSSMGFDAGMRATLATQMAKLFSPDATAINFGGPATPRPVSNDSYIYDEKTHQRRLKRCDEEYSRFVCELWFSVRMAVICGQVREFPEEVAREFQAREYTKVAGDRYELETKEEMKLRTGQSPDLADWLAICVEMARRHGFLIERLPNAELEKLDNDWLEREHQKYRKTLKKTELTYDT